MAEEELGGVSSGRERRRRFAAGDGRLKLQLDSDGCSTAASSCRRCPFDTETPGDIYAHESRDIQYSRRALAKAGAPVNQRALLSLPRTGGDEVRGRLADSG